MEDASADINEAFLNNLSVIQDPKMINSPDPEEQVNSPDHEDEFEVVESREEETSTESLIEEMEAFLQEHEENQAKELQQTQIFGEKEKPAMVCAKTR